MNKTAPKLYKEQLWSNGYRQSFHLRPSCRATGAGIPVEQLFLITPLN